MDIEGADLVNNLPNEVLLHLLTFLLPSELVSVYQVNKHLNELCDDNTLWKEMCAKEWYNKQQYHQLINKPTLVPWKERLRWSREDSVRVAVTQADMDSSPSRTWLFRFKEGAGGHISYMPMRIMFENSFMFIQGYPPLPYQLTGGNKVQVADFSVHKANRNKRDWGWIIQNDNVVFWTWDKTLYEKALERRQTAFKLMQSKSFSSARIILKEVLSLLHGPPVGSKETDFQTNGRFGLMSATELQLRGQTLIDLVLVCTELGEHDVARKYELKAKILAKHRLIE